MNIFILLILVLYITIINQLLLQIYNAKWYENRCVLIAFQLMQIK